MRPKIAGESRRMTISIPAQNAARLAKLAEITGASSESEVIKEALFTHEKLIQWLAEGADFYAVDADGETWPVDFGIDIVGAPVKHRPKFRLTVKEKEAA
jgi:Ribbon-helix-helix protein, copG family